MNCARDCRPHLPPVRATTARAPAAPPQRPRPAPTFESATVERAPPGPSGTRGVATGGLRAGRAGPAGFKRVAGGAQRLGGRGWGRDAAHASPQARLLPAPSSYWLTLDSPPRRQGVALLSPHSGRLQTSAGTPPRARPPAFRCATAAASGGAALAPTPGPKVPAGVAQGFPMRPPAAGAPTPSPRCPSASRFHEPSLAERRQAPKGQEDACPRSLEGNPATPSRFRGFGWSFSTLGAFTSEPLSKSGERPPRAAARSLHLREARGLGRARPRNARSRPGPRAPRPRPCSPGVTLQLGRAGGGNESGAPRDSGPPCRSPLPRAGPGPCPRPAGVPVAASSRDAPRRAVSSPVCADGRPGFPSRPVPRLTLALKRVTCL